MVVSIVQLVPAQSVKDLVALAKAKPGALNYGGDFAGITSLQGELFAMLAGVSISLICKGRARPGDTRLQMMLVRRGLLILVIGLAIELLNTGVGVIFAVAAFHERLPFAAWIAIPLIFTGIVLVTLTSKPEN